MSQGFQIAIDGPVAAGKSAVAKQLAEKLGLLYVDTGAMYRAVAYEAVIRGIDWDDEGAVTDMMSTLELELDKPNEKENDGRLLTVVLDEEDVSRKIRTSQIAEGASRVSRYGGVREVLVVMQQNIANGNGVVMEGRDICSRVLPKAQIKIFMTASEKVRVRRKWKYLKSQGMKVREEQVKEDLKRRDEREKTRKIDPLKPTRDAWVLNTSKKTINQVVGDIVKRAEKILES